MTPLEPDRIIAGRYRLERPLASGGMGSVWVARHLQLDIGVAIKFMAPECASSPDARARFDREAKASALFKNRNVVQVHDYGIDDDTPYLVMELLEGEDLAARLKREGRLGREATAVILVQACKALRRAHTAGLVHRDLKPGNLFLSRQDDEEIVKILDFGIAKATGTVLVGVTTETGGILGSPHYMSPEQVREDRRIDHRSDLWSLGVIAFRCLTGKLPFPGEMLVEVMMAICVDRIPIPSQIAPDLPPEVDRFFQRALAREPEQRFQSAPEFAEALSRAAGVSGQPFGRAEMWSLSPTSDAPLVPVAAPVDAAAEDTPTERCGGRPSIPTPESAPTVSLSTPESAPTVSLSAPEDAPTAAIAAPENAPSDRPLAPSSAPSNGESTPPTSVSSIPARQSITISLAIPRRRTLAQIAAGTVAVALGAVGLIVSTGSIDSDALRALSSPAASPPGAALAPAASSPSAAPAALGSQATGDMPAAPSGRPAGQDEGAASASAREDAGASPAVKPRPRARPDAGAPHDAGLAPSRALP